MICTDQLLGSWLVKHPDHDVMAFSVSLLLRQCFICIQYWPKGDLEPLMVGLNSAASFIFLLL